MIGWMIFGIYILGYVISVPRLAGYFLYEECDYVDPCGEDIIQCFVTCLLICTGWPLIPIGLGIRQLHLSFNIGAFLIVKPRKMRQKEKRVQIKEKDSIIERLERENRHLDQQLLELGVDRTTIV